MKRSEMVNILANSVYKNIYGDSHDFDSVLYDLEQAGMLPPNTLNPKIKKEIVYGSEPKEGEVPYEFLVNEWEPEDE